MIKKLFIAALLFTAGLIASAQDTAAIASLPSYKYHIDSTNFLLGDQVTLTIEPAAILPTLEDLTNNDIVAVRQWVDSTSGVLYTAITSFEPGQHYLHIGSDSVLLTVNDVANVDTTKTEIKDIANIFKQPYTFGEIASVVGIVLGIMALIAAAIYIIKRIREHKPIIAIPQAPPLPADVRALNALDNLRQRQLWQQGMVKEYHTELTDILRNYLEETYHIQSTEMTTDQTLDAFRSSSAYTSDAEQMLRQVLQTADMVKFAKSEPLPHQHDLSLSQSINFVKAIAPAQASETKDPTSTQNTNNQQ